jgi:hypothetical protein
MDEHIGAELVSAGLVTLENLRAAEEYHRQTGASLPRVLVKLGYADETKLMEFIAKREGLEIASGEEVQPDAEIAAKLSIDKLERHEMVPLGHDSEYVTLGMTDSTDLDGIEEVRFLTGLEVKVKLVSSKDARRAVAALRSKAGGAESSEPARKQRLRKDIREIARRTAGMPAGAEAARQVSGIEASPAKLIKALATLLVEKGVVTAGELAERVRSME